MLSVRLASLNDFADWRGKARQLLVAGMKPEQVIWRVPGEDNGLFEAGDELLPSASHPVGAVPPAFMELAQTVVNNADPARFGLLYQMLWRLQSDRGLINDASDRTLIRLREMASAVRRDSHKLKAFVRFKSIIDDSGMERFAAWFEPSHFTLEMTAPFFVRRFDGMVWAIVTPYRSAYWDGATLEFGDGGRRDDVPQDDAVEADWKTYFASIFNPARLKVSMMKSEMPVKYWRNLPEAELIAPLIRGAQAAERAMIERAASQPPSRHLKQKARAPEPTQLVEQPATLEAAREAVQGCTRCPLYQHATQAVFGEGPTKAEVMFIGEQPGDQEDLAGRPFVGPAGKVLDAAIGQVGIDRSRVYVTNAVKHFKFEPRGKRRIHQKPDGGEIQACRFWLDLELDKVQPKVVVALGASAARAVLGRAVTISAARGQPIRLESGALLMVTNHPSYLLRIPDPEKKAIEEGKFADDLMAVRRLMDELGQGRAVS
jgi:probable DNA metabolism protein